MVGAKSGGEAKDMVMMAKETSFLDEQNLPPMPWRYFNSN